MSIIFFLHLIHCLEFEVREKNIKPKEIYLIQKDLFDSISVEKVRLNNFGRIPFRGSEVIIKDETLKKVLEDSILESGLAKKIELGNYSIEVNIVELKTEFGIIKRNSNLEIRYVLKYNQKTIQEYLIESDLILDNERIQINFLIEQVFKINFQKFLFELSKTKL